jgi:hypothetical protein
MTETTKDLLQEAKPQNKWRDPDFLRKYYREKRRKDRGGLKRHPNILDDGTLWSESQPEPPKPKIKKPKVVKEQCGTCGKEYYPKQREKHLTTKIHNLAIKILSTCEL